jgi:hypothetical protein
MQFVSFLYSENKMLLISVLFMLSSMGKLRGSSLGVVGVKGLELFLCVLGGGGREH